ncbi:hypothetical protein [Parasphingorhabdus sp.]|uniref:hypothetical protein n=1 Tax=Parasphingorhabdus sp. TaxID=2709688 RepID=UPI0032638499
MTGIFSWRSFWFFWLGGLIVFSILVATGSSLMTEVAPSGILDHQSAATADRVNEIQQSWTSLGLLNEARWSMIGDLVFIGLYMSGGIIGGRLIWQEARSPSLKKLGLAIILIYFVFGLSDYIETISQITQLIRNAGSDLLAGTAATARPIKIVTWIAGTLLMVVALIWRRSERHS